MKRHPSPLSKVALMSSALTVLLGGGLSAIPARAATTSAPTYTDLAVCPNITAPADTPNGPGPLGCSSPVSSLGEPNPPNPNNYGPNGQLGCFPINGSPFVAGVWISVSGRFPGFAAGTVNIVAASAFSYYAASLTTDQSSAFGGQVVPLGALTPGNYSVTATFIPADPTTFAPSSNSGTLQVGNCSGGGGPQPFPSQIMFSACPNVEVGIPTPPYGYTGATEVGLPLPPSGCQSPVYSPGALVVGCTSAPTSTSLGAFPTGSNPLGLYVGINTSVSPNNDCLGPAAGNLRTTPPYDILASFQNISTGQFSAVSANAEGPYGALFQLGSLSAGTYTVSVFFQGGGPDANGYSWLPSSATGTVIVGRSQASSLTLSPAARDYQVGGVATLTATAKDAFGNPVAGVSVNFNVTGVNTASGSAITDVLGHAPFSYQGNNVGQDTVFAFADNNSNGVQDSGEPGANATVLWYGVLPNGAGGAFVIGDREAALGTHVTFWGAKWSSANPLSGGLAPSAFKGFVDTGSTSCGNGPIAASWTTGPGNSSSPPSGVPQYIAVIVTSQAAMAGSRVGGNVQGVAILQTNAGYAGNPGATGTGTVVAILC